MSEFVVYDRKGKPVANRGGLSTRWSQLPSETVLYADPDQGNVVGRFLVGTEGHQYWVDYFATDDEFSLETFYVDVSSAASKNGWNVNDSIPSSPFWVFPNIATTEPRSLNGYAAQEHSLLDERVVEYLAREEPDRHLDGDFDPTATVQLAVDSYEQAVQIAKYVLSEIGATVAIVESETADIVDDADVAIVPEGTATVEPLNPKVLKNGHLDRAVDAISEDVDEIETAEASAIRRFYSLSTVRTLLVDWNTETDYDRNVAVDDVVRVEDRIRSLPDDVGQALSESGNAALKRIAERLECMADDAVDKYLDDLEDYVQTIEDNEDDTSTILDELDRCLHLLDALADGETSSRDPPGRLRSKETAALETATRIVLDEEQLRERCADHERVDRVRGTVDQTMHSVAKEMYEDAKKALDSATVDPNRGVEPTTEWQYQTLLNAYRHVAETVHDSRDVHSSISGLQRIKRRFRDDMRTVTDTLSNAPNNGARTSGTVPDEFERVVEVLGRYADHEEVADHLTELASDVQSERDDIEEKHFGKSIQETAEPAVIEVEAAFDEDLPGQKIADELDQLFSETPLTVRHDPYRRRLIRLATTLAVGFLIGLLYAL